MIISPFACRGQVLIAFVAVVTVLMQVATRAEASPPSERIGAATPITPNEFQGTDVERINRAIAVAAGTGRPVVIPRMNMAGSEPRDVWLLDSAILLPGDTTLILQGCHLKLSDRCRDNFIRSANCGLGIADVVTIKNVHICGIGNVLLEGADHPRATGDAAKTIGKRTYGTDAGDKSESQTGDWRNIGILLAHVEHFSIENLTIKDSHAWAVSLERCAHGRLRDLNFESQGFKMIDGVRERILNQDGVDLRLGCHDILIENISGYTGDDLIALTAIPRTDAPAGATNSTMVSNSADRGEGKDDIRHVMVRNVRGYCRGGHHIIRLLNTSGVRMHDILIDGLIDTSPEGFQCRAAVKIGDHAYGGGVAPVGDTSRIIVTNLSSRAEHTILVGGSLSDSVISNIVRHGSAGEVLTAAAGQEYVRDVTVDNVRVVEQ